MIILITGSEGFIGSHMALRYEECDRIDIVKGNENQVCSIIDYLPLKHIMKEAQTETIFHYAAQTSVPMSMNNPCSTFDTNINGTYTLCKAAYEAGVKNIVFASSSAVYGDQGKIEINESSPLNPMSPYAISKLAGEGIMNMFTSLYGMKCCSLRLFNVYGPHQKATDPYSAVIAKFMKNAKDGTPLNIYGDGLQTRDFVYIDDVLNACEAAVGKTGTYNIATSSPTTIKKLAEIIIELSSSDSHINPSSPREGDIYHSRGSFAKAKESLGWKSKVSLREGLKGCIPL